MWASVRSLFTDDANDTSSGAPTGSDQPNTSSASSETQDIFSPLTDGDATPERTVGGRSTSASTGGTGGGSSSSVAGGASRAGGIRGVASSSGRAHRDSFAADTIFEDDETDTGGPKRRRPLAQRADVAVVEGGRTISTLGDAVEHVRTVMDRQIERGHTEGFEINKSIQGDGPARTTFYTLLPDRQQRDEFLRVAGNMRNWPRLRGLFGAPPYHFLRSDDGQMLRAAGIAAGRSSMSYDDSQSAAGYAQFGAGQLVDAEEREYRVTPNDNVSLVDPAPWLLEESTSSDIVLQVRVKKRDKKRKLEMMKDKNARKTLTFPRPGDRIVLSLTPAMLSIQRRRTASVEPITLKVRRVIPRGESAATAVIVVQRA